MSGACNELLRFIEDATGYTEIEDARYGACQMDVFGIEIPMNNTTSLSKAHCHGDSVEQLLDLADAQSAVS